MPAEYRALMPFQEAPHLVLVRRDEVNEKLAWLLDPDSGSGARGYFLRGYDDDKLFFRFSDAATAVAFKLRFGGE